jgi:hypothetical protein
MLAFIRVAYSIQRSVLVTSCQVSLNKDRSYYDTLRQDRMDEVRLGYVTFH